MDHLPCVEVVRALLPSRSPSDRAWSARFVWNQAVTSDRTRRWGGPDPTAACWLYAVDQGDTLRHIFQCPVAKSTVSEWRGRFERR